MPKIEPRDGIEVYVTRQGSIALKQGDALGNEPAVVHIYPDEVGKIVGWLNGLVAEATQARAEFVKETEFWVPDELSEAARRFLRSNDLLYKLPADIAEEGRDKILATAPPAVLTELADALRKCGVSFPN